MITLTAIGHKQRRNRNYRRVWPVAPTSGIGTTSPGTALDVSGAIRSSISNEEGGQLILTNPSKTTANTALKWSIYNMTGTYGNSLQFWNYDSGACSGGMCSPRLTILDNGNVGIGTTSPTQGMLTVNGNVAVLGQSPMGAGGTYVALTNTLGTLPGYPSYSYPTIKTDSTNLYLSINGNYSGYFTANGAYTSVSDRNRKENFVEVDAQNVLAKLDAMPMFEWNFKGEDLDVRHIGPIAQDFHDAFHLNGPDEKKISHIDPAGVAIVGVKGLLTRVKDLEAENTTLKFRADKAEAESAQLKVALCSKFPDLPLCTSNLAN